MIYTCMIMSVLSTGYQLLVQIWGQNLNTLCFSANCCFCFNSVMSARQKIQSWRPSKLEQRLSLPPAVPTPNALNRWIPGIVSLQCQIHRYRLEISSFVWLFFWLEVLPQKCSKSSSIWAFAVFHLTHSSNTNGLVLNILDRQILHWNQLKLIKQLQVPTQGGNKQACNKVRLCNLW